jgi:hypothetical protein
MKKPKSKTAKKAVEERIVYKEQLRELTQEQIKQYEEFVQNRIKGAWIDEEIKLLVDTFSHVFAVQYNIKTLAIISYESTFVLNHLQQQLDKVYYDA